MDKMGRLPKQEYDMLKKLYESRESKAPCAGDDTGILRGWVSAATFVNMGMFRYGSVKHRLEKGDAVIKLWGRGAQIDKKKIKRVGNTYAYYLRRAPWESEPDSNPLQGDLL